VKNIKKRNICVLLFGVALIAIGAFNFFYKRNVSLKLIGTLPSDCPSREDYGFHPLGYRFIHSDKDFRYIPPAVVSALRGMNLDFKQHSYLMTRGKKIGTAHYSPMCAIFHDETPRSFRRKGKTFVCIERIGKIKGEIYIYEVDNNKTLTGYNDQG